VFNLAQGGIFHMHRMATRILISFCLLALPALAQENRIVRVGVAMMRGQAGHISGHWGQDRLVAALNQQKPDKKQHIKLQGVPLEGDGPEEVENEAKKQNCDYVIYTTLADLQASTDSVTQPQQRPGTVQPYPGGGLGLPPNNPNNGRTMNAQYRAIVDYRLYRSADQTAVANASVSNQGSPEEAVVSQLMNQVASRVFAEIKKAPPLGQ
jgi:hypothetical protein